MQNQPEMRSKWRAAARAWPRARGPAPPQPMLTKNSKTMVRISSQTEKIRKLIKKNICKLYFSAPKWWFQHHERVTQAGKSLWRNPRRRRPPVPRSQSRLGVFIALFSRHVQRHHVRVLARAREPSCCAVERAASADRVHLLGRGRGHRGECTEPPPRR